LIHSSAITDLDRQNTGKATVLGDAARVLRDLITQVESLRKEQSALVSERQYVSFQIQALYTLCKKNQHAIVCMNSYVSQLMETTKWILLHIFFKKITKPSTVITCSEL